MSRRYARIQPSGMSNIIFRYRKIKNMAKIVNIGNSHYNIKLTIINTKISIEANLVLFDFKRIYTIRQSWVLVITLSIISAGSPIIDELKYPLVNSFLTVINKLATSIDNENRQSNIKMAIINTQIYSKSVSIVFDNLRLYNFRRVCVF